MTDTTPADRIYHFARPEEWEAAQAGGFYRPAEFDEEGFIHCATSAQVAGVVDRHLHGRGLRLRLTLDPFAFGDDLQYEWSERSGDLYPHLFAPIPVGSVLAVETFDPDA